MKRGSTFHLRRRVPRRYRGIEPRETVWISLHTDSETIAKSKADRAWSQMIEAWEARLAGNSADAEAARDLAKARGFRYLDAGAVAKLPVGDVVERVEAIPSAANQPDAVEAAALLGTVPEPRITVTKALELYWTLAREKTFGKKPMVGSVRDYYENTIPMLLKTDRFGFNNLKRRFMFWYKSRSEPTVNGPVTRADHRVYGHIQASLVAENLMLSLAAHGYESCPMGGIDRRGIRKLLGPPSTAEVTMVIGAGTGTPQGLFSKRVRLPYGDLVKEV
jgi:hypothetical protein